MSRCSKCWFYESGYMFNQCNLFGDECFVEPDDCEGFSSEAVSDEDARKLFERIIGVGEEDG